MRVDLVAKRLDLRLLRLHRQLGSMALLLLDPDAVGECEIGRGPAKVEPEPVHKRKEEVAQEALPAGVEHDSITHRLDAGGAECERSAEGRLLLELAMPERAQAAVKHVSEECPEQRKAGSAQKAGDKADLARFIVELRAHQHDSQMHGPEKNEEHARAPLQMAAGDVLGMVRPLVQISSARTVREITQPTRCGIAKSTRQASATDR
jgi:hypothetical protein